MTNALELTSATADPDLEVTRPGFSRVHLEYGFERRQHSVFNAWTGHSEQAGGRRPCREWTA